MEDTLGESGQRTLAPVESGERIHALDVVRGVALVGIFLMNVEFFNRPIADLGEGLPSTLTCATRCSALSWDASIWKRWDLGGGWACLTS